MPILKLPEKYDSVEIALKKYFTVQKAKNVKCKKCGAVENQTFKSIMNLPNILMIETSAFYDTENPIENLEVPETLDFIKYINPLAEDVHLTKYQVFGMICKSADRENKVVCLIKKRLNSIKKF